MNIQQAEDLKTNSLWPVIVEEIDLKIKFETQKLLTCKPEDLRAIQLKIEAYQSMKNLPQDVIDRETTS